jgi:phosphatidylcholine synthase
MKTADNYFRGFPALWNAAAFYLLLWKPVPSVAVIAVIVLAVMTFLPVRFIHPFRVARLRAVSLIALLLWTALAMLALARNLDPGIVVSVALTGLGIYFLAGGFLRAQD